MAVLQPVRKRLLLKLAENKQPSSILHPLGEDAGTKNVNMKRPRLGPQIPELGQILKFILDCFDIRRDGNPLTCKQVERLSKGKDISREALEKVARAVLDTIYQQLNDANPPTARTDKVLENWVRNPGAMSGLSFDNHGNVRLPDSQVMKDAVEFCWRHQYIIAQLQDSRCGSNALYHWLSGFVIPYITSTLVDYSFTVNNPDSGMPGGRLWYLPEIERPTEDGERPVLLLPSQQVLLWWEDLLGSSLENNHKKLCGETSDPDNARRQIAAWKQEAKPPDSETIRRWTKQTWDYQGVFSDDPSCPLHERWRRCREFLAGKGMLGRSDWIAGAEQSQADPERNLAKQYRGERLEQEIPPFRDHPFAQFLESPDPVKEGLPVEKLIERVSVRWRVPSRTELHSRLMIGRAMNSVWNACSKQFGLERTLSLARWAGCSYNHFMEVFQRSEKISALEGMRIHQQMVDQADPAFHPLAAMLDERYWLSLPEYLRPWIRDEVHFKS